MKKNLLVGFVAAMTLASCTTNDEVLDAAAQTPMEFSSFVNKTTKAPLDLGGLQSAGFSVWGYKQKTVADVSTFIEVFQNTPLTYAESKWSYSTPTRYWDKTCIYDFYAYAPTSVEAGIISPAAGGVATLKVPSFTVSNQPVNYSSHTDLLIADRIKGYNDYTSKAVEFTFRHALTKLSIGFTTSLIDQTVLLKTATLKGVINNRQYTHSFTTEGENKITGVWTAVEKNTETELEVASSMDEVKVDFPKQITTDVTLGSTNTKVFTDLLMIPQEASGDNKKSLFIEYTINGELFTNTIDLSLNEGWNANQNIIYNINISATQITFNATVTPWEEKDPISPEGWDTPSALPANN